MGEWGRVGESGEEEGDKEKNRIGTGSKGGGRIVGIRKRRRRTENAQDRSIIGFCIFWYLLSK